MSFSGGCSPVSAGDAVLFPVAKQLTVVLHSAWAGAVWREEADGLEDCVLFCSTALMYDSKVAAVAPGITAMFFQEHEGGVRAKASRLQTREHPRPLGLGPVSGTRGQGWSGLYTGGCWRPLPHQRVGGLIVGLLESELRVCLASLWVLFHPSCLCPSGDLWAGFQLSSLIR